MEMEPQLLHGTIEATISKFQNIESLFALLKLEEFMEAECGNSQGQGHKILYATVYLDVVKMESKPITIKDLQNTNTWEMKFKFHCAQKASHVIFSIHVGKALNGRRNSILEAKVPVGDIVDNDGRYGYPVDLIDPHMNNDGRYGYPAEDEEDGEDDTEDAEDDAEDGEDDADDGEDEEDGEDDAKDGEDTDLDLSQSIHVNLKFTEAKQQVGIGSPDFEGVPEACFALRNGCKVTLYQDAHIPADYVDKMSKDGVVNYEPKRCWEDIFDAIKKAEKFVYIAGWSLCTEITLLRDPTRKEVQERQTTLGELLKRKAETGQVKVVLLISDDPTAVAGYGGVMGIRSKEAKAYFRDTNVQCVWCSRHNSRVLYSHHQKIVVVDDSDVGGGIVSFIGGIDLCRGRYDTPDHSLFRTLQKNDAHNKDFHQASFVGSKIEKGGPREPWHDVHCRLEGPAACYVYDTFVQRCKKEGKEDILVPMNQLRDFFNSPSHGHQDNNNKAWNVQVFRSIDDKAVLDFPKAHHRNITKVGPRIFRGKYKIIDHSIEDAYIEAIRRAKNFIYIENEYFIGSDFGWSSRHKKFDASALIPKEISLKIVSKIKAKEKFAVYVVIPMWPEGDPHGDGFVRGDFSTVQDMLLLQRKTIEMMYKDIVEALKQEKIKEDPQRYLSFFCLGNREVRKHGEHQPQQTPHRDLHYKKAQTSRRFMIYVHSKMMIVDDEYIIIGSANINHRSMDGGRDTEIAMGAYQPSYLASGQNGATGQIHGFRMSLWLEHLGKCEKTFINPESKECVSRVNQLAEKYWKSYSAGSFDTDLPGHLLRYPIQISNDGTVQELPEFQYFPDTFATILGKQSPLIHNT